MACNDLCSSCEGPDVLHCTKCNYFSQYNTCVRSCSRMHFENHVTKSCERCHDQCDVGCTGSHEFDCISCVRYKLIFPEEEQIHERKVTRSDKHAKCSFISMNSSQLYNYPTHSQIMLTNVNRVKRVIMNTHVPRNYFIFQFNCTMKCPKDKPFANVIRNKVTNAIDRICSKE